MCGLRYTLFETLAAKSRRTRGNLTASQVGAWSRRMGNASIDAN